MVSENILYYGDNLDGRRHFRGGSATVAMRRVNAEDGLADLGRR